jgi:hypothetical protein
MLNAALAVIADLWHCCLAIVTYSFKQINLQVHNSKPQEKEEGSYLVLCYACSVASIVNQALPFQKASASPVPLPSLP